MLDDYKQLCEESEINGNWIAWKNYIIKYEALFSSILEGLYMVNLEELKPMIETVDFKVIYNKAKDNAKNGCIEEIIKWVNISLEYFDNKKDFVLYIGCEIGNILGCVLPVGEDVAVYFGMETIKDIEDLKSLVPHEINHFIRQSSLNQQSNFRVEELNKFKERVVAEGLGVYTSFRILGFEDNTYNLAKVIGIPEMNIHILLQQEKGLEEEVLNQINNFLNVNMMGKYFGYTDKDILENRPVYTGYFIGFRIIQKLYSTKKYSLQQLTVFSADKILEEYLKLDNL